MNTNLRGWITCLVVAVTSTGAATFASAQTLTFTVVPGAACLARNGNEETYLRHGLMGTGNNLGGVGSPAIDVICPLTRLTSGDIQGPVVRVFVLRDASATLPLSCTLDARTASGLPTGAQTKSFNGTGEGTIDLALTSLGPYDYYQVLCTLPYLSGVRSIRVQN